MTGFDSFLSFTFAIFLFLFLYTLVYFTILRFPSINVHLHKSRLIEDFDGIL